jgi:hypothetical protein
MKIKQLILWFGIVGSFASIISLLFIFIPRNENIILNVNTQGIERLTQNFEDDEPDLKVNYKFKGFEIKNLWKYTIQFQNKSRKTIIGNGNQKNILTDNLTLNLKQGYNVLEYKKIKSDFNSQLKIDSTKVNIFFEQWRENETLEYSFYVKTDISKPDTLLLEQPKFRQIIDGDIVFNQDNGKKRDRITEVIPQKFRLAGYVVSMIFLTLFIIILTIFLFLTPISFYKVRKWKTENFEKYSIFIEKIFADANTKKNRLLENPIHAPDEIWEKFEGEKFPNVSVQIGMTKLYQPLIAVAVTTIVVISLVIAFLELIYLF